MVENYEGEFCLKNMSQFVICLHILEGDGARRGGVHRFRRVSMDKILHIYTVSMNKLPPTMQPLYYDDPQSYKSDFI